jgi:hypothetical protein
MANYKDGTSTKRQETHKNEDKQHTPTHNESKAQGNPRIIIIIIISIIII